jgi:hypothetical protein
MKEMTVSDEMTSDRGEWRRRHAAPSPNELGKGQKEVFLKSSILFYNAHVLRK